MLVAVTWWLPVCTVYTLAVSLYGIALDGSRVIAVSGLLARRGGEF